MVRGLRPAPRGQPKQRCLGAIADLQLLQQHVHMAAHRAFPDPKLLGDGPIAITISDAMAIFTCAMACSLSR